MIDRGLLTLLLQNPSSVGELQKNAYSELAKAKGLEYDDCKGIFDQFENRLRRAMRIYQNECLRASEKLDKALIEKASQK